MALLGAASAYIKLPCVLTRVFELRVTLRHLLLSVALILCLPVCNALLIITQRNAVDPATICTWHHYFVNKRLTADGAAGCVALGMTAQAQAWHKVLQNAERRNIE